jgi:hypothetical protein
LRVVQLESTVPAPEEIFEASSAFMGRTPPPSSRSQARSSMGGHSFSFRRSSMESGEGEEEGAEERRDGEEQEDEEPGSTAWRIKENMRLEVG